MENQKIYKYSFRVTEKEKNKIDKKIEKSKLSKSEYFLKSALNQKINIVSGLEEFRIDLKRIGNNINQISRKANQENKITSEEIEEVKKELNEIWQFLNQLEGQTQK